MTVRNVSALAFLAGALFALADCGGGGSSPGGSPTTGPTTTAPTATPVVTPTPNSLPTSSFVSASVGGPNATTVTVPAVAGYGLSLDFPGSTIPAGTTVGISNGPAPITGVPTLSATRGQAVARGSAAHTLAGAPPTALDFVGFEFSTSFGLDVLPGFTFTLTPPPAQGEQYLLAFYSPATGWVDAFDGPAILSGSTLTFAPELLSTPLAIQANTQYVVALYTVPGTSPTPQPVQSPVVTSNSFSFEPLPLGGGTTVPLAQTGAYGGSITFPAVVAGNDCSGATPTASGLFGTSPPPGSPLFSNQDGTDFYIQVTFSCTVVIVGPASASLTVPSGSVGVDFVVGNGVYADAGLSATPTGTSPGGFTDVTLSTPPGFTATIPGKTTYTIVLYPLSAS